MFGGPIPYGAAYNARPVSTRVDQKMWFEK
jgi:hypothetical protein